MRLSHRVDRYAEDVDGGKIVAGPLVRLACDRHLRDRHAAARRPGHPLGLFFHEAAATHIIEFFEGVLRLPDTLDDDGDPIPFLLTPANTFIVGSIFGWKMPDGYRRYREAYVEEGKGNAKALALDTPIPTPDGWRMMVDLHVGDQVFDERGRIVPIIVESPIAYGHECFEVVFDDGSAIIADAEHLWSTEQRTFSKHGVRLATFGRGKSAMGAWRHGVSTTREIAATLRYANGKYQSANHSVPLLAGDRRIVDVRPVPSVPVKCIGVDTPSHLYLAGRSMIPTHNTPIGAGIGLYGMIMDGEMAAEIYSVATGIEQSRICWRDADRMVEASPDLRDLIYRGRDNLAYAATYSWFRPLTKEKRGKSGPRPHIVIFDEEHEYADAVIVNKMRAGMKRRKQPLSLGITNSGYDRTSICWQHHEHARKMLEGVVDDQRFFAFVCGLDEGDDPLADKRCHIKSNPNLGIVIQQDYLDRQVQNARNIPSETNTVLRLNFCVWTHQHTPAWNMPKWHECGRKLSFTDEDLIGAPCFGGLDLGQNDDFAAWCRLWDLGTMIAIKMRFWLPQAALEKYPDRPYGEWKTAGLLEVTEGDTTDLDLLEDAILEDSRTDGVLELAYDRRFANQLALHLQGAGVTMVDTPQGYALNESIKSVSKLIADGKLAHGNHLIMTWMMDNTVLRTGHYQQVRLDKDAAKEKIDGPSALVMANARRIAQPPELPAEDPVLIVV